MDDAADSAVPRRRRHRGARPILLPDGTMRTGPAAAVLGISRKTAERMVDDKRLRGGRIPGGSHRWIDARHVVQIAVAGGRQAMIPAELKHLIGDPGAEPDPPPSGPGDPAAHGPA